MTRLPLVSETSRCIWSAAPHCAFTDLIFFGGRWLCCFRESDAHAYGRDGEIRLLASDDGETWQSEALFSKEGYDLRDPRFSVRPDGVLMLHFAGRTVVDGEFRDLQCFAHFSDDGHAWGEIIAMQDERYWIWQIRWQDGIAYSWARTILEGKPFALFRSEDGVNWQAVTRLTNGNETSICFLADGRMLALRRHTRLDSMLAVGQPTDGDWNWKSLGRFVGGPNLLRLNNGTIIFGCRFHNGETEETPASFVLGTVNVDELKLEPRVTFTGGGIDCGYPGFVEKDGRLHISHYTGSKETAAIYLSQIPLQLFSEPSTATSL